MNKEKIQVVEKEIVDLLVEYFEDCDALIKENEELKDRIDNYNTAFKKLQDLTERKINENEQLKNQNELLSDELEQCKAVIDYRWSEYLKKKEEQEND